MKPRFTVALLMAVIMFVMTTIEGKPAMNREPIKFSLNIKNEDEGKITEKPRSFELNSRIQDGMVILSTLYI
jgi:hypothetical protein